MALGLDRPLQRLDHVAQMLAHGRFAGIGISGGERIHDRFVLAQRACGPTRSQDRPGLKPDALGLEISQETTRRSVIGDRPDPLVELGVEAGVPHGITSRQALSHPDDRAAQVSKVSGANALGGMPDDQLFEDNPNLLDLQGLAIGYQADAGTTVRLAGDQALLVQPDQRRTDGGPAGVKPKREVRFDQALVGVKATAHDLTA
jgi:hypothetical protein